MTVYEIMFVQFIRIGRCLAMDNLLPVSEVSKRLGGISKWTVYAWLSQGKLRRTKVGGRTMIRESELAKVIRDGETPSSPEKSGASW